MIQVVLGQPLGSRASVERATIGPDVHDVCYAMQNRQQSVHDLAKSVDLILVVGSKNSSGPLAPWSDGVGRIGLAADTSAPETLVQDVIAGLRRLGEIAVATLSGIAEDVKFKFPAEVH